LALWWSKIEALNEIGEKEKDHLTTKNLSETRTLSYNTPHEKHRVIQIQKPLISYDVGDVLDAMRHRSLR